MYKTIMVPSEGTGFDREAIRVALRLATMADATIHLVRVMKSSPLIEVVPGSEGLGMVSKPLEDTRDRELAALYLLAAECREVTSATIVTALEDGPVSDVLEAYSARVRADIIVMSSHARHGLARLSFGSVTDLLIRSAHVPVLVVKQERSYLNPHAPERFSRMIIPLDGSTLAEQILEPATQLAKLERAEVVLLQILTTHDQEPRTDGSSAWWEEAVPMAHAYLNRWAGKLRSNGIDVSTDIVVGSNISDAIAAFASSRPASLIAIATHGRSGLRRAVRGSVADELVRNGGSSLLVLNPLNNVDVASPLKSVGAG